MEKLKIGIVEDETVIADTIDLMLRNLGYDTTFPAASFRQAMEMVEKDRPDLLLLDILLNGAKDGIDLAKAVREKYPMPVIFLTANSDVATVTKAKTVKPDAFLVKPFTKNDLYAAIEIAAANYYSNNKQALAPQFIMVKDGYKLNKVYLSEMNYLESEGNYIVIHTIASKKIMTRATMAEILEQVGNTFARAHRSYAINLKHVTSIDGEQVVLANGQSLALSKSNKELFILQWQQALDSLA